MKKMLFVAILLLAIFLRIFNLQLLPPSLNWDEVSLGYNVYSILKTGQDEWGQVLPLSFRAFGDYKLPGYIYLNVPFVATFGLNEWGVRIPSTVVGVGTVLMVFLILKYFTGNFRLALWGALLAAISPWPLVLSRIALEANLALFLTAAAIYTFFRGLSQKGYFILSAILLGLSVFTYNSSRVVAPLLLILVAIIFKDQLKRKKEAFLALIIFLIFFMVVLPKALLQDSSARYKWTAILDEGAIQQINSLRATSKLPEPFDRIVYNKATYFIGQATQNYFLHFHPDFLFLNGGSHFQYSIPGSGLFYLFSLPFLLLGLWKIIRDRQRQWFFVLGWWILALIPAAITRDAPHALRSLLAIPPILMITAVGVELLLTSFKKLALVFSGIILLVAAFSFYQFFQNYTGSYVKNYSWAWQYGYKEAVNYIKEHGNKYSRIYLTKKYGEPHEFILFYLQYDPEKYRSDQNLVRYFRSDWYWVDSFDKFIFLNDWEIKENVKCRAAGKASGRTSPELWRTARNARQMSNFKCLLITSPGNYPDGSKLLKSINFLNDKGAFDIVELESIK